jgi:ElaB/YqjD/DUF883 family membrane-anchored ribosome-binding protein
MAAKTNERSLDDITREAQDTLDKAGKVLTKQANQFRKGIAHQLREAAAKIREQVAGQKMDAEAQEQVNRVLSRLDEMGDYLEKHTLEQIEAQAKAAVKENVWRNLLIAFIIGLVVGIFIARND